MPEDWSSHPTPIFEGLKIHSMIGSGAFSKVYKVQIPTSSEYFALKMDQLKPENSELGLTNELLREVSLMKQLDGKFIVKPLEHHYFKKYQVYY